MGQYQQYQKTIQQQQQQQLNQQTFGKMDMSWDWFCAINKLNKQWFFKWKNKRFLVKKIIVTYWIHFYWWTKNNNKRQYNTTTIKSTAKKSNGFVMRLCASTNWNNNEVLVKTNLNWLHFFLISKKTIPKDNTTTIKSTAKKSNCHEIGLNTSMYCRK